MVVGGSIIPDYKPQKQPAGPRCYFDVTFRDTIL